MAHTSFSCRTGELTVRSQRGFTLIELMVTVVIIGILSSISLSAFQWLERERLETETLALRNRLESVKQLSLTTRRPWQLCAIDATQEACEEVRAQDWSEGYYWNVSQGENRRLKGSHRVDGVAIDWNRGGSITFSAQPWEIHTLYGTFTLCNAAGNNTLTINDGGRIRLTRDVETDTECRI